MTQPNEKLHNRIQQWRSHEIYIDWGGDNFPVKHFFHLHFLYKIVFLKDYAINYL